MCPKNIAFREHVHRMESLRNYKPKATYSSPRNQVLDIIIKKGYARYQAEAILDALWKLHDKDPQKIAYAISRLTGAK